MLLVGVWPRDTSQRYIPCPTEYGLIDSFLQKVLCYDPDALVSHDLYGNVLDIIIQRATRLKITLLSRLGRLKQLKDEYVKASNAQANFQRCRLVTKGRLLIDTYLGAKELIRETDYDLTLLSRNHLGKNRIDIPIERIKDCYQD